jgi:hypothetical protein
MRENICSSSSALILSTRIQDFWGWKSIVST